MLKIRWNIGESGTYISEVSEIRSLSLPNHPFPCPRCQLPVTKEHLSIEDKDSTGEDTYGWNFTHDCGANILVVND